LVKFETFRVIEQRRQIDQNAHGSNLSRISREPYGFSQLRSAKGFQAESFRRSAHLRHPAVRFHHPGTRDEPIFIIISLVEIDYYYFMFLSLAMMTFAM
jgi:hypothetical protein